MQASRKRRSDSPGERRAKSPRVDAADVQEEDYRSGVIKRICLRNFMCHTYFEVNFNERINFIVGRNGSGKSAVLTALVIGFGGKAGSTQRASSIKDFIKKGQKSAVIQIEISNLGLHKYKPDIYGPSIIVVRTIRESGGSSYQLLSSEGRQVSTKHDDLKQILITLNISIDNPLAVLNQEMARTFLCSNDSKLLYSFFVKATQLEEIEKNYRLCEMSLDKLQNTLEADNKELKTVQQEFQQWEKKHQWFRSLQLKNKRIVDLQNEFVWSKVVATENQIHEVENAIKKERTKITAEEQKDEDQQQRIEAMETAKRSLIDESRLLNEENSNSENVSKELKAQRKSLREELQMREIDQSKAVRELKMINGDIKAIENEIEKTQKSDQDDYEALERENNMKKEENAQKQRKLETKRDTHQHHRGQLQSSENLLEKECMEYKNSLNQIKTQMDNCSASLKALENKKDNLYVYGDYIVTLEEEIDKAFKQKLFAKRPIGPVGKYIKVKEEAWTPAVEFVLGRRVCNYCVDSMKDNEVLENIIKRVCRGKKPGVYISRFLSKVHDVRSKMALSDKYSTLLGMMEITNPVVANMLIDSSSAECILLIPNTNEAMALMSENHTVPRNCSKAITLECNTIHPVPNYRFYAGPANAKRTRYLQTSVEQLKRNLLEELNPLRERYQALQKKMQDTEIQMKNHRIQLRENDAALRIISTELYKLNQESTELSNWESPAPRTLSALKEDLNRKTREFEVASQHKQKLAEERTSFQTKLIEVEKRLKEEDDSRQQNKENVVKPLMEKLRKIDRTIEDLKARKAMVGKHRTRVQEMLTELQGKLRDKEKLKAKLQAKAEEKCPTRIETDRNPDLIQSEIAHLHESLKQGERNFGTQEEVEKQFLMLRQKRDKMNKLLDEKKKIYAVGRTMMVERWKRYQTTQKVIRYRVNYLFQGGLEERHMMGQLKIDFAKKQLDVDVKVNAQARSGSNATKTLSGGERSYSTVCLILALWETMEQPFYMMDEFDVFMDLVNRRISMDMLIQHATDKSDHQYVLLTPNDIAVKASDLLTIHKLSDPSRPQRASL